MRRLALLLNLSVAAFVTEAAHHAFPGAPWTRMRLVRSGACADVVDDSGAMRFRVQAEPRERIQDVYLEIRPDGLSIDPSRAFAAGLSKLVCVSPEINDTSFSDEYVVYEANVAGLPPASIVCGMTMQREVADGKKSFHYVASNRSRPFSLFSGKAPRRCRSVVKLPPKTSGYRLRFDIPVSAKCPYIFNGASVGRLYDLPPQPAAATDPKLLFHVPFDGTEKAQLSKGRPSALRVKGITYGDGVFGASARFSSKAASSVEYAFAGNANPAHGAVSLWLRRDPQCVGRRSNSWLFTTPSPFNERIGTGSLYLWLWEGGKIRADNSNDGDLSSARNLPRDSEWHHVVFNYDRATGCSMYVDGIRVPGGTGGLDPVIRAVTAYTYSRSGETGLFERFSVGSSFGSGAFDGWIDDLRIYSAPLRIGEVERLRSEAGKRAYRAPKPDYAALSALRGDNPYVGRPQKVAGDFGPLTLVKEWKLDSLAPDPTFRNFGGVKMGMIGDVPYIEAGRNHGDRFAMKFDVDPKVPFYVLEFDYPDDAKRTMDIIVQEAGGYVNDYALQVGVLTGDDVPVSGRIRTHRCIYWTRPATNLAFIAMTARNGGPAALSAFRICRTADGRLPPAAMKEPPDKDGWGRSFALYYEDAAVNYDFSVEDEGATPEAALDMADRCAAVMKFTGENLFAYPAIWYEGPIGATYNPRNHAPDFLSAFYERFDREGLGVMPLINQHELYTPDPSWFTTERLRTGRIHDTPVSVASSGFPDSHITLGPPAYNIAHPSVRAYYAGIIDALIAQGTSHPSFKGVGVHLKYSGFAWFGSLKGGYNDYCIDAFEKATGVKVPVDRKDPARGRLYAEWLLKNERERWIRWRCDLCTGFWIEMARKLSRARKGLKLWINNICVIDASMEGFRDPDYIRRTALEGGLDANRLAREAPNIMLGQTTLPADYRTTDGSLWFYRTEENRAYQRMMHMRPEYWDFVTSAIYPVAHQHDRYWEDATGNPRRNRKSGDALSGPARDLDEHNWRVSTLNPAGEYSMQHFAQALFNQDMLGVSKGGYLIGTYGMEEFLAPFAQAFRALPPVRMRTLPGGGASIRMRQVDYAGNSWFYLVNASEDNLRVTAEFPQGTEEVISGVKFDGPARIDVPPYGLRSFRAPSGLPVLREFSTIRDKKR